MNNSLHKTIIFVIPHPAIYTDVWFEEIAKNFNLKVIYLRSNSKTKPWKDYSSFKGKIFKDIGYFKFIKNLISGDLIILCGTNYYQNISAILILKALKKKIALFSDFPRSETLNNKILMTIKKSVFKLVNNLLVVTEECKRFYIDNYNLNENSIRIFPYAHKNEFKNIEAINRKRQNKINNGGKIKIFISNRFIHRKGYDTILEALKMLKNIGRLTDFEISIAGTGPKYNDYKIQFLKINQDIRFLGWIEINEYYQQLKNADILLHASLFEPYGIPPLDAMNNRKLVVVSDGVKSVNNIISNGQNGFIYKSGDENELYKCLLSILNAPNMIYEIAETGKNSIINFDVNKIIIDSINETLEYKK